MRAVGPLVAFALAALVHPVLGDAKCKISEGESPANTPEFERCKAATGYVFSNPAGIDVTKFCSNADCKTYWLSMAKYLQCFQYSASGGTMVLNNANKGNDCFNQYMGGSAPAPAPAPATTSAPSTPSSPIVTPAIAAPPSTPSETTKTPSTPSSGGENPGGNTGGNTGGTSGGNTGTKTDSGGDAGVSGTTATSDSQSTTTSTPSNSSKKSSSSSGSGNGTSDGQGGNNSAGPTEGTPSNTANKATAGSKPGDDGKEPAGKSATAGSGSATTGNDASKRRQSSPSGSGSGSASPGGGGGSGDDDRSSGGSGASSVYAVAGGSGGGVLVCIFAFVYFRKRADREANAKKLDTARDDEGYLPTLQTSRSRRSSVESLPVMGNTGTSTVLIQSKAGFWEDEVITAARIPFEKLKRGALISRGGYGEVYRGAYRGEHVAIKTLLRERRRDLQQIEKFLVEVKLMATLEHENIVRFIGVAWDSLNELCVVSEFMAGGDLRSLLMAYDDDPAMYPRGFNPDKIKIAMHIAHALTYMHSLQPAVLHRDLKSRNILLDADLNAKLTDFGISRERADTTMTIGVGSSLWIAPEVMMGGHYNEKADVFSLGVVLSELGTHRLPYAHAVETGSEGRRLPDTVIVQMMTSNRIAVQFTDESASPMAQIGRRCVAVDPAERPSAAEVQHLIHQISRGFLVSTST